MMNFADEDLSIMKETVVLYDPDFDEHRNTINWLATCTDDLIDRMNRVRKEAGMKDLVSITCDNNVWYDFYVVYEIDKDNVYLFGTANESEEDDWANYEIPLEDDEKESLLEVARELYEADKEYFEEGNK